MTVTKNPFWRAFKIIFFIIALASFKAWFFWSIPGVYTSFFFLLVCIVLKILLPKVSYLRKGQSFWFFTLFVACMLTSIHRNLNGVLDVFFSIVPLWLIIGFKDEYKLDLFQTFNKLFGWLLLASISYYILFLIGMPLPSTFIQQSNETRVYENFFLFIRVDEFSFFERFCSFFLEPGYLGCLLSLLLFANGFHFNKKTWYNWVYLVGLLLTLSLAGYGLTLLGLFFTLIIRSKGKKANRVWMMIGLGFAVYGLYLVVVNYNGGNNVVNEAIVMRLEYDEAEGTIAGNNRSTSSQEYYFYNTFLKSDDVLFGVEKPVDTIEDGNADWKVYVISYGFVGLAAFLFFLLVSVYAEKRDIFSRFCLTILYLLMFSQTVYGVYWLIYISTFVLGMTALSYDRRIIKKA